MIIISSTTTTKFLLAIIYLSMMVTAYQFIRKYPTVASEFGGTTFSPIINTSNSMNTSQRFNRVVFGMGRSFVSSLPLSSSSLPSSSSSSTTSSLHEHPSIVGTHRINNSDIKGEYYYGQYNKIIICSSSSSLLSFQRKIRASLTTRCFGTKRMLTEETNDDDNNNTSSKNSNQNSVIPGSITIYNEQSTLPNINISKIEQTISIIREIINYPTYDINLILVDDEEMKQTNYETRQLNKPTDILSFPFHDTVVGGAKGAGLLQEPEFDIPDYYTLGDMMIDVPYVIRRCEEDKVYNNQRIMDDHKPIESDGEMGGKDEEYEYEIVEEEYEDYVGDDDRGVSGAMANIYDPEERIRMLLVHGMLHLVGYDHIEDEDYEVMVRKEEEVLELLNKRLKYLSLINSDE